MNSPKTMNVFRITNIIYLPLLLIVYADILEPQVSANQIKIYRRLEGDLIDVTQKEDCDLLKDAIYFEKRCFCENDMIFHNIGGRIGCYSQAELGGNMSSILMKNIPNLIYDDKVEKFIARSCSNSSIVQARKKRIAVYENTLPLAITSPLPPPNTELWVWKDGDFQQQNVQDIFSPSQGVLAGTNTNQFSGCVLKVKRQCGPFTVVFYLKLLGEANYEIPKNLKGTPSPAEHNNDSVKDFIIKTVVGTLATLFLIIVLVLSFVCLRRKGYIGKTAPAVSKDKKEDPELNTPVIEPEYEYISQVLSVVCRNENNSPDRFPDHTRQSMGKKSESYEAIRMEDIQFAATLYHLLRQENISSKIEESNYVEKSIAQLTECVEKNARKGEQIYEERSRIRHGIMSPPPYPVVATSKDFDASGVENCTDLLGHDKPVDRKSVSNPERETSDIIRNPRGDYQQKSGESRIHCYENVQDNLCDTKLRYENIPEAETIKTCNETLTQTISSDNTPYMHSTTQLPVIVYSDENDVDSLGETLC